MKSRACVWAGIVLLAGLWASACDNNFKTITLKVNYRTNNDDLVVEMPASELARIDGDFDTEGLDFDTDLLDGESLDLGDYDLEGQDIEINFSGDACSEGENNLCLNVLPRLFSFDLGDPNTNGLGGTDLKSNLSKIKGLYLSYAAYKIVDPSEGAAYFKLYGIVPRLSIYLSPQLQPTTSDETDATLYHDWQSAIDNGTLSGWKLCEGTSLVPTNLNLVHMGDTPMVIHSTKYSDLYQTFPAEEQPLTRDLANAEKISQIFKGLRVQVIVVPCGQVRMYTEDQSVVKQELTTYGLSVNPKLYLQLHMSIVIAAHPF